MAVDLPADVKPKIKSDVAGTESIQIHVRGTVRLRIMHAWEQEKRCRLSACGVVQESGKLSFKVKQSTKFFKVFDVYCKNKGIDPLQ
eukprot:3385183-Rhodomonas_salina.3